MIDLEKIQQENGILNKTICGEVYSTEVIPATIGLHILKELMALFENSLGALVDGFRNQDLVLPEDDNLWTRVLAHFTSRIMEQDVVALIKQLLTNVKVNDQPLDFDKHFAAAYHKLALVVEWIFTANFKEPFIFWLKEKGFIIPSLSQMLTPREVPTQESSDD